MEESTEQVLEYMPSPEEQTRRALVYGKIDKMLELKGQTFPHFSGQNGARSFNQYVEDSELILNGFSMSRGEQGKEPWQSNMLDNLTLAKLRATATGVGLRVPDMHFSAKNIQGISSSVFADILKNITRETFRDGNPTLHAFLEVWTMLSHGGLLEYEGYRTGGAKYQRVKSFDSLTGAVQTEAVYKKFDSKPYSVIINPSEFCWWDMFRFDIQAQPCLAWIQRYSGYELKVEFSKYKNFKYVKNKQGTLRFDTDTNSAYYDKWSNRLGDDEYEVVRFYSKEDDTYEIWVNGVPLLRAPLLWMDEYTGEKYYPFAKSISNPFANTNFFWGMSYPAILESYQDTKNTVLNTMADILYRSFDPRTLVGLGNKDILEFEQNFQQRGNRYYVPDITQIRLEPTRGLNNADFGFLNILDRGIENMTIDRSQQGLASAGGGKTAREVVIANERAQELKGMLYLFLEDLWLQKTRLRVKNIINHYIRDKAAASSIRDQIISVYDYTFPTGEQGQLDIHVAQTKNSMMPLSEINAREQAIGQSGDVYKIVSIVKAAFAKYKVDCYVIPETLYQADQMKDLEALQTEVQTMISLFPKDFLANSKMYLTRFRKLWGKSDQDFVSAPAPAPSPNPLGGSAIPPSGMSPLQEGAQAIPKEEQPLSNIIQ